LVKPDIIDRNLMVALARKHGMVYLEEFLSATSNAEKVAVIQKMLEKEHPEE
jgi:hypothetical protein